MYKIKRIKVKGLEGLSLAQISSFEIRDMSEFSIILGRNGSGKSKIMSLYFPVAPAKKQFVDGGYYENESETSTGTLLFRVARINGSLKCSIKNLDTKEYVCKDVNPKVYNNHVETLTGLNLAIVKLLTGKERFTKMSTIQRKAWLDRFSSCDMTYALSYFKRLKENHRDSTAVVKHYKGMLAEATENLAKLKDDHEEIDMRLATVEKDMNTVNQNIAKLPESKLIINEEDLENHFKQAAVFSDGFMFAGAHTITEKDHEFVATEIEGGYSELGEINQQHTETLEKYNRIEDKKQRCEYYLKNLEPAREKRDQLKAICAGINDKFYAFHDFADCSEEELKRAKGILNEDYIRIDQLSDLITPSEGMKAVARELSNAQVELDEVRDMLGRVASSMQETGHLLSHYDNVETVECPKCSSRFKPGLNDTNPDKLRSELELLHKHEKHLNEELEKRQRKHAEVLTQNHMLREIQDWMMRHISSPVLSILINRIASERVVQKSPRQLHLYFKNAMSDIDTALEAISAKARLQNIESHLDTNASEFGDVEQYRVEAEKLSSLLERLNTRKKELLCLIETKKDRLKLVEKVLRSREEFKAHITNTERTIDEYLLTQARKDLFEQRELYTEQWMALRERSIKAKDQRDYVKTLERDYGDICKQNAVLKDMITWLSPEKGLLKRYYYNTVMRVIDWMNVTLEDIWDYPLEIMPCPLTDNELSYTFPYRYGQDLKEVDDVSEGSEAQQQIFDLVFRIMAYKALNLTQYPLLLDEPGTGFDELHRVRFIDYIRQSITDGDFSQLVLISHYSDVHSRLNKADFIVVDPEGLTLPAVYNDKVTVEYYGD